jgi:hypothetical protein
MQFTYWFPAGRIHEPHSFFEMLLERGYAFGEKLERVCEAEE